MVTTQSTQADGKVFGQTCCLAVKLQKYFVDYETSLNFPSAWSCVNHN